MKKHITGLRDVRYDGFIFAVEAESEEPYFLRDSVGFNIRIKNEAGVYDKDRQFFFIFLFPDGKSVLRPSGALNLMQGEETFIGLHPPIYLGFLGYFALVLAIAESERHLNIDGQLGDHIRFETLHACYVRDILDWKSAKHMEVLQWIVILFAMWSIIFSIISILK